MWHKHEAAVELLLQTMIAAGIEIDARYEGNKRGRTLLMVASALGLTRTVAEVAAQDEDKKDPIDHAANNDVEAAFAKHLAQVDITDQSRDGLLLLCARFGMASHLPAVLQAGANIKYTDEKLEDCASLFCS